MDIPLEKIEELINKGEIAKKEKKPLIIIQSDDGTWTIEVGKIVKQKRRRFWPF